MRALVLSAIAACLIAAQAAAARESASGGAYETLTAPDAGACAARCDADNLCVSWRYTSDGACALRANIGAAASGFSRRAPDALRARTIAPALDFSREDGEADPPTYADDLAAGLLGGP